MAEFWENDPVSKSSASAKTDAGDFWANDPVVNAKPAAKPKTSLLEDVEGAARSATRGAAPTAAAMATGAAIGGGLGAMGFGVGAIPGAALGAALGPVALSVSDLATAGYNALAQKLGYTPRVSPTEAIKAGAEALGIGRPGSPVIEAMMEGGLGALTGATAARAISPMLTSQTGRNVANVMAEQQGMQTVAGGVGSAVPAAMKEYGDVTNPYALAAGGLASAAMVPLGAAAGQITRNAFTNVAPRVLSPFIGPTDTLKAAKLGQYGDIQEMAAAMQAAKDVPTLPGAAPRSAAENLAVMGQPNLGLTGLEASLAGANPKMAADAFARRNQNIEAIQRQLAGLDEQIKTQAGALTPTATAEIKTVRDSLLRNLADEEQALANTAQGVARPLPNVSQSEVGGGLRSRGQALETETQRQVITPAYEKSFDASKNAPIDLTGMIGAAKRITNDLGSLFDASTVPESVRKTLRLEPSTTPGEWVQIAPGAGYAKQPPVEGPPQLSLRDFDTVRKALNREYGAASRSNAPDADVRARNLKSVITQMDADLAKSAVPDEAKTLYGDALKLFQTEMVPSFRTGETGKMLSEGQFNMPATLPSKQVAAFLGTEEGATQFVRTFGKDAQALEGMKQGVLDLYRRGIVDPTTRAVSPTKAAAFETKYARQLAALEKAGVDVRGTMAQVRGDAEIVQRGMETLASEAKKFRDAVNAKDVVDLALKSSSDMNFVKQRLTPDARQALVTEVTDRATQFIKDGAPEKALEYLTKNERAIKTALGKGDKSYAQIVDLAKNQTELAELFKSAPKTEMITSAKLAALKPSDLAKIETVANEIKLMRQQDVMARATGTKESGAKVATEYAEQVGVSPKEMPTFFAQGYTVAKNMLGRVVTNMNKKTLQAMTRMLIENPDEIIALAAKARKAEQTRAQSSRQIGMKPEAFGASQIQNFMAPPSDNRNAMAR